jgi:hypothetical protein
MRIKRFLTFKLNETAIVSTPKSDLDQFKADGYDIKYKKISDENNPDSTYDVYWGRNARSNDFLTITYSGKFANPIGGSEPSVNDIWMHATSALNPKHMYKTNDGEEVIGDKIVGTHLIIKTLKDDKVPENVILQAADIVRKNSHLEKMENNEKKKYLLSNLSNSDIVVCTKDFVRKEQGSATGQVQVDHRNSRYVKFSKGRVEITH